MWSLFARDIRLSIRAGGGALTGVIFFLAVIATIPFGVGPDLKLLARIGPAILWIGALLSCLLGLDRLFQADREDGSLDLLVLGNDRHMLAIPVLIFGVSASYGATADPDPFLQPFLILAALTLFLAVLGPASAALALRHGTD